MTDPRLAPKSEDYSQSHLQRGGTYDEALASVPFDAYMAQLEKEFLLARIPILFPHGKPRYLDFACGTGRIMQTVAPLCSESIGVDVSETMLAEAQMKCPSVQFLQADVTRQDVDLGSFDLITSFRFFGNAQQKLRVAVLEVLHRLLKSDGYLIINSHRNPRSLATMLTRLSGGDYAGVDLHFSGLKRLLRSTGFEIVTTKPIGVWMYRSKLMQDVNADSAHARKMESRFGSALFTPIAPDAVIVARKIS